MDNVVTSVMVFAGNGLVREFVGGYGDWIAKGGSLTDSMEGESRKPASSPRVFGNSSAAGSKSSSQSAVFKDDRKSRKLSYGEKQELEAQPALIEKLEADQSLLEKQISSPDFYNGTKDSIEKTLKQVAEVQKRLEKAYRRWEELEKLQSL